jgi:AFG3 family protein
MIQIYRHKHVKGASGTGTSSTKKGPFGGGGMNDMMGMGKSNVQVFGIDKKIKTRFKHVAGME